jgi:DNA-binding NarL/FixJ family response regulator
LKNKLIVASNGEEGLKCLEQADKLPILILLDLNMPRMGGIEFLETIKQDERYKHISVVVLTTSDTPEDIRASYECYAAGYMVKPVGYKQFVEVIRTIEMYWRLCKTP